VVLRFLNKFLLFSWILDFAFMDIDLIIVIIKGGGIQVAD
jgi:hypothetical protein